MLKRFLLNALSSFVGAWVALLLLGAVAVMVCIGLVAKFGASSASVPDVGKGSVLRIDLSGVIEERYETDAVTALSMALAREEAPQDLITLTTAIAEAAENKNISAIYLQCGSVSAGNATLSALRQALSGFKESGKKIIAYGGNYNAGAYYVASVADSVFLNPCGGIQLNGIGTTSMFMKGLFDKLGITFQVVKVGTFKSAVEPYILTDMSGPARAQLDTLFGTMWEDLRTDIAASRGTFSASGLDSMVNGFLSLAPAPELKERGLVDRLEYGRSMDSIVASSVGKKKKELKYVSAETLVGQTDWGASYDSKRQVAVLYATGEIVDGGPVGTINYQEMVPSILKLADDKKVKGMVLRVNSPGGAVYGSEQIGEALDYFQSKGKPLAVSMGDYAASGGYWISACADRIFADPLTVTGSIGVFGLIPEARGLLEKIGVNAVEVSTNPEADFPNVFTPMTERQHGAMQESVDRTYSKFVARVARGRKMTEEKVRVIGEGRVWSAPQALKIGLVDQLGQLDEAVDWIARKADLGENYDVALYPLAGDSFIDFLPELAGMKMRRALAEALTGNLEAKAAEYVAALLAQKPLQARMPLFTVKFAGSDPLP